ncbi:MAG: Glu-tRNA(Gln) amidotransferase subunit GatD [Candidatus Syntropharchaeia archaeon]
MSEIVPGDRVRVEREGIIYEGILMPTPTDSIVIKLDNGYNVGFRRDKISVSLVKKKEEEKKTEFSKLFFDQSLPVVSILSTGGTIASRVDYRTGAVTSQFTAREIIEAIPELKSIANYNAEVVYSILSENMRPEYWITLARRVYDAICNGSYGIMITHGTDTMGYTAAALSFMLETPVPVVLVGSQRSADRPSSDNAMNAVCAAKVACSDIAEVCVVMHGSTSDDFCYIHRGTRVRKMHTSARDAFKSINEDPLGKIYYSDLRIEMRKNAEIHKRGKREPRINDHLEKKCCLIKFYPGSDPDIIDFYVERGYRGIVLEGTGLGHVSTEWIPKIEEAIEKGVFFLMTSQCIYGRVCDRVYDTGRDLLRIGVIEGEDMLPETALVKLMWALGKTDDPEEVKKIMSRNIAGEIRI